MWMVKRFKNCTRQNWMKKAIKSHFNLEKEIKKYIIFINDRSLHVYRRLNEEGEMWYLRLYKEKNVEKDTKCYRSQYIFLRNLYLTNACWEMMWYNFVKSMVGYW